MQPTPETLGGFAPSHIQPISTPMSGDLQLLAEWWTTLGARDLAEGTRKGYGYGLFLLLSFHGFQIPLIEMGAREIVAFVNSLPARSAAKKQYSKGLRSFFGFLVDFNYRLENPTAVLHFRPVHPSEPESFSYDDLVRLLIAAWWRGERRAWAIMATYSLGCRRTEMVNIRLRDIDYDRERVYLSVTKGDRPRYVNMGPLAMEAVKELERWSDGDRLLPVQPNTLTNWVHQAGVDCGFSGRKLRAHTLRATFITDLLNNGVPVHVAASLAGHRNIATTSSYAAVVDPQKAAATGNIHGNAPVA